MYVYSLRAEALNSSEQYAFTALDTPVIVGPDEMILAARPWSPKLKLSTVIMGADVGVFVGDILEAQGDRWVVLYSKGFYAESISTQEKKLLYELENYKVVGFERQSCDAPPEYKVAGTRFRLHKILGRYNDLMLIWGVDARVRVTDIQQGTGLAVGSTQLYLGDMYKGLPVVQCYGRVCTQDECGAFDILKNKYIKIGGYDNE